MGKCWSRRGVVSFVVQLCSPSGIFRNGSTEKDRVRSK